jgi:acetate---CoA ligase (ADP-forming)
MSRELDAIMQPKSIAVIGASTKVGAVGNEILSKLLEFGYTGDIYPVNPKADEICGKKVYKSISDIPADVEMAVIIIPKDFIPAAIDQCAQKGVKGLVIISAGYKETGAEGLKAEQALAEQVKKYGMKLVGPNCLGVINTAPEVMMDASFAMALPVAGRTAFISQSGALGAAILNLLKDLKVGLSQFVSIGNAADCTTETFLDYWKDEPNTDQILLYMETISDPAEFGRLAKQVTKKKPVVAIKAGRSAAGASAASSHTGSLAGADLAADALLKQSGVIRATSVLEMFEVAQAFENCPIPKGKRVAVITNSGGPGIMATDAICELGLEMAQISEKTKDHLRSFLPAAASVKNPIDMIATAPLEYYPQTLEAIIADENVDAIMMISVPFANVDPMDIAKTVMDVKAKHPEKPILCVMMTPSDFFNELSNIKTNIPFYQYPESAANAIAKLYQQHVWMERPEGKEPNFSVNKNKAIEIISKALKEDRSQLTTLESIDVLDAYGIRTCKYAFASNVNEAANEANKIGYPVVMKITSTKISHKTEVGGVIVGITSEEHLRSEYADLIKRLEARNIAQDLDGVIVQEMVKGNREMVCGVATDPQYGHLMMFGLGGIFVETLKDVAFRVNPLTDIDVKEMVQSVKDYKILKGARGEGSANIDQIEETLLRLSQLVNDFPFIKELDINPLKISDKTAEGVAVDGRIEVVMEEAKNALGLCCCSGNCCS